MPDITPFKTHKQRTREAALEDAARQLELLADQMRRGEIVGVATACIDKKGCAITNWRGFCNSAELGFSIAVLNQRYIEEARRDGE